jgi:hypothetical protein
MPGFFFAQHWLHSSRAAALISRSVVPVKRLEKIPEGNQGLAQKNF